MSTRTVSFRIPFLIGAVLGIVASFVAIDAGLYIGQHDREVVAVATSSTVADLVTEHGCWTGEAPTDMAGVVPGHVIVTVDGEARYAGARMVGKALEQIFVDVDHGLRVHAFCE